MNRTIIFILIFAILATFIPTSAFAIPDESKAINKIPSTNPNIDKLILVEGNPATMSADIKNGKLHIKDKLHTHRQVRLNYIELFKNLKGFNGQTLGYTHINDYGITTRKIIDVGEIDNQGFISIEMTFSTVIVDGFVGTTTTILTRLSGNQSISVPDGSSYDLNITNNPIWVINGTNYSRRVLWTLNTTSENLTDLQVKKITPYDSDMQPDMDDRQLTYYENDTLISFWDEKIINSVNATSYVKVPKTSTVEQQKFWLYYGNSSVGSASNGSNVFPDLFKDFEDDDLSDWNKDAFSAFVTSTDYAVSGTKSLKVYFSGSDIKYASLLLSELDVNHIIEYDVLEKSGNNYPVKITISPTSKSENGLRMASSMHSSPYRFIYLDRSVTWQTIASGLSTNTWYHIAVNPDIATDTFDCWWDNSESLTVNDGEYHTVSSANNYYTISMGKSTPITSTLYIDNLRIRKNATIKPTWLADSTEQTQGTVNITASVTGNSNEQSYNISQTRGFTLTPTGTTNNVFINTTSTDYNVTVTTYWTEDTIKISETLSNGYANITVQYTPSDNITAGVINATYNTINFAAHDYTGNLSVLVDGADYSSNGTRLLNDVNTTIVNFDTSTHYINFSVPYNPPLDLYSPNDTETLSYAYPPLTHDVVLSWEQSTGTYKYTVTDYDTGAIISTNTANTNSTTIPLPSGHYKWYINGYDDVFNEYSISSEIRSFTIEDTYSYSNDTVLHGIVYEYISGVETPLDNALVNIWNDTWSDSQMTGTNGYFVFQNLHNSTYFLKATKNGYLESVTEIATLPYNTTLTRDILLQLSDGAGQQYVDHYVKFTVKSLWETLYSNVAVTVYRGEEVTALYTGTTGEDGSVAFELNENQEYRITFIDAEQEINKEITLYPVNNDYVIYVFTWSYIPDDTPLQTIDYGITYESINLTAGTIYASFTDTEPTFTHANFTIKAEDGTVLHSFTTTGTSKNWSQIVTYNNSTIYIAVLEIFDTGLTDGKITQSAVISFKYGIRDNFDLGWEEQWQYQLFGALLMLFVAGLFSMTNAHLGAIIVVGIGWFNIYAGWFVPTITGSLMMLLGTFLAVIFVMRKQEKI